MPRCVRIFFQLLPATRILGGTVVAPNTSTPRRWFKIQGGLVHWENGDTEPGLLLKPGETAPLTSTPEDNCDESMLNYVCN
jgi:hypothetical protein